MLFFITRQNFRNRNNCSSECVPSHSLTFTQSDFSFNLFFFSFYNSTNLLHSFVHMQQPIIYANQRTISATMFSTNFRSRSAYHWRFCCITIAIDLRWTAGFRFCHFYSIFILLFIDVFVGMCVKKGGSVRKYCVRVIIIIIYYFFFIVAVVYLVECFLSFSSLIL